MRITTAGQKAAYIIVGYLMVVFLNVFVLIALPDPYMTVLSVALNFTYVFVGVRTFRGPEESVRAARPWWRMTGSPLVGFIVAALIFFLAIGITLLGVFIAIETSAADAIGVFVFAGQCVVVAFLYVYSSERLLRAPQTPAVPRARDSRARAQEQPNLRSDG